MSGHRAPAAYHRVTARSSVSATPLPILGGSRATPDADDRMPLLFDDMAPVPPRESGHLTAVKRRGMHRPTTRNTSRTSADSLETDLLPQRSSIGGAFDAPASSSAAPMLLTVRQVESALQLGRTRTYELLRSGRLPMLRVGRLIRVSRVALEEWIAQETAASCD
jgi:excisionase family DNA binding protein